MEVNLANYLTNGNYVYAHTNMISLVPGDKVTLNAPLPILSTWADIIEQKYRELISKLELEKWLDERREFHKKWGSQGFTAREIDIMWLRRDV